MADNRASGCFVTKTAIPAMNRLICTLIGASLLAACGGSEKPGPAGPGPSVRPSILLVTLDTTRADAIGPEARGLTTPAFNALAARGRRFRQAYATVPETLPSHVSMMTGLYPAGHGIHENARFLGTQHGVVADRLRQAGYRTAAFVSSFVLTGRFGLSRGFDAYDDERLERDVERSAKDTTDRALAFLASRPGQPAFVWVHYFDPHAPYAPPEPYRTRFAKAPYLGEVAAMDEQLGRLVQAFEQITPAPHAILVVGDHGEGLGDHGESQHGLLLYQPTMLVPMVAVGPGFAAGANDTPVSTRRVFHTLLDWAGLGAELSLRHEKAEPVLGEAMKPFLSYGWQPQIMVVEGRGKGIDAGRLELYDLAADPGETRNLWPGATLPAAAQKALDDYPAPSPESARAPGTLSDEARRNLASLGYVSATAAPVVRRDAPRPADMVGLFEVLERASGLFVAGKYDEVVPLLESILKSDPHNLDAMLRLATAHSSLGRDAQALPLFARAAAIAPASPDVRVYRALHEARGKDWARAVPVLEQVAAETPGRLPVLEALARIRERQGRDDDALALWTQVFALRPATAPEAVHLGELAMAAGRTDAAIDAFERARALEGEAFRHDLELGVLYLAARRIDEARAALDRVPPSHPEYPMTLFKRAQVSVLLKEPDAAQRVARARQRADASTRDLIARERLFAGM
jgi:arylsulfatase A-like enzyme/thioredoxin-like negative regulator of GroEL